MEVCVVICLEDFEYQRVVGVFESSALADEWIKGTDNPEDYTTEYFEVNVLKRDSK